MNRIGKVILKRRKELNLTQQMLADKLDVSCQAVSKWENGNSYPEIEILPALASILHTSVDALLGYTSSASFGLDYENRYNTQDYYWGIKPNELCLELLKLMPPTRPLKVLDIGCGEGKDAVFLARNGYIVSAFDITENGIEKGKRLAAQCGVNVHFFRADITDYKLTDDYDIIFCSGVLHFVKPEYRSNIFDDLKKHTNPNGLHVMNVFVEKPFLKVPENKINGKNRFRWNSGELSMMYADWYIHEMKEFVFDCNSGGTPHQHCMDVVISQKEESISATSSTYFSSTTCKNG